MFGMINVRKYSELGFSKPEKYLKSEGFRPIGSGSLARVYHKCETDYVVKLTFNQDDGYLAYAQLSFEMEGNPYFPKVHDIQFLDTEQIAFLLEKLNEVDYDSVDIYNKSNSIQNCFCYGSHVFPIKQYAVNSITDKQLKECIELIGTLILELRDTQSAGADVHSANVMCKGNQVVITDPIYTPDCDNGYRSSYYKSVVTVNE